MKSNNLINPTLEIPIAKPPWTKLGKRSESSVRKALYEFDLIPASGKVAIALSGGKDSLALLFLLHAISGRGFVEFDLHAFHVHGEYSCGASVSISYLKAICSALSIPFTSLESKQKLDKLECYSCSRERRSLLFNAAKKEGYSTIAFGHHRDDHSETLLMNLLHKGEFAGNLPKINMIKYEITIIRPLIFLDEETIRTFAQQNNFARVMCQCPVGQNSKRRQVKDLIKQLEQLFPNAAKNLAEAGFKYGSDKASKI
jgi:tRNA 2-thiocytidine biosynthesis protein TtcA